MRCDGLRSLKLKTPKIQLESEVWRREGRGRGNGETFILDQRLLTELFLPAILQMFVSFQRKADPRTLIP